jgi:hypothetical protein
MWDIFMDNLIDAFQNPKQPNGFNNMKHSISLLLVSAYLALAGTQAFAIVPADFNVDGKSDLILQNTVTGQRSIWLMNGSSHSSSVDLGSLDLAWQVAATGDFNADNYPDLLLENDSTGERRVWLMNGTALGASYTLGYFPQWLIAGTADFNADGKTDIVWQNKTTGERSIWLMDGTNVSSVISLGIVPIEWSIIGCGDFDADNKPDLVFQNTVTGERRIWLNKDATLMSSVSLGTFPTTLQIAMVGDYNNDGKSDLVWQNYVTGERYIWLMNGTTMASSVSLGLVSLDWAIGSLASYPKLLTLYHKVLLREPTSSELIASNAAVASGQTLAQVYQQLLTSSDYKNRRLESVIRLYYAALARGPDYGGLINWSDALKNGRLLNLAQAAQGFADSPEFRSRYGDLNNAQYVQQLYRNVLGREPDPEGLAGWTNALTAGASRGDVLVGFSESEEFKKLMSYDVEVLRTTVLLLSRLPGGASLASWVEFLKGEDQTKVFLESDEFAGLHSGAMDDSAFVRLVYSGFLRRTADSGELALWTPLLGNAEISRDQLVFELIQTDEYEKVVAPVFGFYAGALGRPPDASGLDNWASALRTGLTLADLAKGFAYSPEFMERTANLDNTQFVQQLYLDILGRASDPVGLAEWVAVLNLGQVTRSDILDGFVRSTEAQELVRPDVRTYLHYFTFFQRYPSSAELVTWRTYLNSLETQFIQEQLDSSEF